jgi:hypothetical protein
MHADPLALTAFRGPQGSEGVLLFVILLTALLILMIYAVVRAPAWQPPRPTDGAGPEPGDRPAPLPRRRAQDRASSMFQPLPVRGTAQPAVAAGTGPASAGAAAVAPVPHRAEPDPQVLERPVVTGRPPWGPAPRPPGLI